MLKYHRPRTGFIFRPGTVAIRNLPEMRWEGAAISIHRVSSDIFMNVLGLGRHKRIRDRLTIFIVAGTRLFDERFVSSDRFANWMTRYRSWHADVQTWMSENYSGFDCVRFRCVLREGPSIPYWPTAGGLHNQCVNQLRGKLMFLGSI